MNSVIKNRTLQALARHARIAGVLAAVIVAGLFMAACGDSSGPRRITSVVISPATPQSVAVGGTVQFSVVLTENNGDIVTKATPTWSVTGGGTITQTGLFTAGSTPGTSTVSVTCSGITVSTTVTVTAGPLFRIAVLPQTVTLNPGGTQLFTASGFDANNNPVAITPVWTVRSPNDGSINASTGLFTAGPTPGSYPNTVRATAGGLFDEADVIVLPVAPPPPPSGGFTILGRAAVTCSTGSIIGDVGTFQAPGDAPPGSITPACTGVTTGTVHPPGDAATKTAYNNFLTSYTARTPVAGDCDATHTLTGTLAGVSLAPGVYCFTAAAALTGTLTLNGPPTGVWLFKIGTAGTGDLTGTNFTVLMAGGAVPCNVTWWVRQASSMTTSNLKGTVMAGTGVTFTGGTFIGNGWAGASGTGDATETGTAITGCP